MTPSPLPAPVRGDPLAAVVEAALHLASRGTLCSFCAEPQKAARAHFAKGEIEAGLKVIVEWQGMACTSLLDMQMEARGALSRLLAPAPAGPTTTERAE